MYVETTASERPVAVSASSFFVEKCNWRSAFDRSIDRSIASCESCMWSRARGGDTKGVVFQSLFTSPLFCELTHADATEVHMVRKRDESPSVRLIRGD